MAYPYKGGDHRVSDREVLRCTRDFIELLKKENQLWILEDEVDPHLELAQIQREVCRRKGPAVLYTRVKGTPFPVVTNLYGSARRLELAFGKQPFQFIQELAETVQQLIPPTAKKIWAARGLLRQALRIGLKNRRRGAVFENSIQPVDLLQLPQIKSWPEDGGAFITLPLVYTESPSSGKSNLGMYRMQMFDATHAGMHIQIHRGGGFHYYEAETSGNPLPVNVFIGGPPAMTLAAIAPLPEDVPELLFASLLMGEKLEVGRPDKAFGRIVWDSDFCLQGWIPPKKRRPEGPFGDHYGYYSLCHEYPYMEIKSIHYRKGAIYPATVVGRPPQEDHYIAEFLQEILVPLFPLVMPSVIKIWAYEESGVHTLAGAVVRNRYYKEAFTSALRILGEGQLSLTKFLLVTDQNVDPKNFKEFFTRILERTDFRKDLFILSNISQDTLDYTGPRINEGSKAILLGLGEKKRILPSQWRGTFRSPQFTHAEWFCPGVLCVTGTSFKHRPDLARELVQEPDIQDFAMVFLLDDARAAVQSPEDFIWHVFTRFEPAADIYGRKVEERFHVGIEGPVVVDCRLKPWYPKVLEEDPEIAQRVKQKWGTLLDSICKC
jgi:UbiD family decarboxylase